MFGSLDIAKSSIVPAPLQARGQRSLVHSTSTTIVMRARGLRAAFEFAIVKPLGHIDRLLIRLPDVVLTGWVTLRW